MTVSTFYPETSNGWLLSDPSTTWADARAGSGTIYLYDGTNGYLRMGDNWYGGTNYECAETFLNFDTSAIPDTDVVTSAVLSLYGHEDACYEAWTAQVRLKDWGDTLSTADFVAGANLSALPLLATFAVNSDGENFVKTGYNAFTSESAFVTNISKTGFTRLIIASDNMVSNTAPGAYRYIQAYNVQTGTVYRPKLEVTHAASGSDLSALLASGLPFA
jgi:hypothetical protein